MMSSVLVQVMRMPMKTMMMMQLVMERSCCRLTSETMMMLLNSIHLDRWMQIRLSYLHRHY